MGASLLYQEYVIKTEGEYLISLHHLADLCSHSLWIAAYTVYILSVTMHEVYCNSYMHCVGYTGADVTEHPAG